MVVVLELHLEHQSLDVVGLSRVYSRPGIHLGQMISVEKNMMNIQLVLLALKKVVSCELHEMEVTSLMIVTVEEVVHELAQVVVGQLVVNTDSKSFASCSPGS